MDFCLFRFLKKFLDALLLKINKDPSTKININLEKETISVLNMKKEEYFPIDPYKKICLMNGYNDIDYILSMKDKIIKFENKL